MNQIVCGVKWNTVVFQSNMLSLASVVRNKAITIMYLKVTMMISIIITDTPSAYLKSVVQYKSSVLKVFLFLVLLLHFSSSSSYDNDDDDDDGDDNDDEYHYRHTLTTRV